MISFSNKIMDDQKSKISEILPQWETYVLDIEESAGDEPELSGLNFLVNAKSRDEFKQWLAQFEEKNKTTYSVRNTEPSLGKRVIFKQRLTCQHNTRCGRLYDATGPKVTKNTNCPSKMTVTIHSVPDKYRGKGIEKAQFLKQMPCELNLMLKHNHSTGSAASLRFRKPSDDVTEKLISLFKKGHSPATALDCIKTDIQLNFQEYPLVLGDRSQCPDYNFCYHLYNKIFKQKYGPMDFQNEGKEFLQQRLEEYNNEIGTVCAKMVVSGDDYVICICSPLMQKVHRYIKAASQMAFMDSTGSLDHDGSRVFVLLTHSECGGLPLGMFVTSSERCEVIEIGFQILKELVGEHIFGGNIHGPSVFLTDDCQSEQNAIRRCFPSSRTLLCVFHVLQAVWRWLIKSKHGIPQEKQFEFFEKFKKIMFSKTKNEATVCYNVAKSSVSDKYENYQKYLEGYWARREEWAKSYRIGMLIQGHNTNNISEAFMKIMKDKIFERIQAFNVVQMVDFLITKVNLYFQRRLLDVVNRGSHRSSHKSIKVPSPEILAKIKQVNEDILLVPSEDRNNHYYIVNMAVLICTCFQGNTGKICKHIDWASTIHSSENYKEAINTESIRKMYYFIATGEEPPKTWLQPLYVSQTDTGLNAEHHLQTMNTVVVECEPVEEVAEPMAMENIPKETNEEVIADIQELITEFSNRSPNEVRKALEVMRDRLRKIKTPSTFASHALKFGEGQSRKNHGRYIAVQPTAISRRKKKLVGRRSHPGGRQRKSVSSNKENVSSSEVGKRVLKSKYSFRRMYFPKWKLGVK